MLIKGNAKSMLFDHLRSYLAEKEQSVERIFVRPTYIRGEFAAPTKKGKRKYTQWKAEFGLDPTVFANPETINMLVNKNVGFSSFLTIPRPLFNELGFEHAQTSDDVLERQLTRHPELRELLDDFLPKWEAAMQRAVAKEREDKAEKPT